jgi:hypothetical protein
MPRQLSPGAGASNRAPSHVAAARPPAHSPSLSSSSLPSPSCPLPPQRYRALRARYNALLVTLYERTSLTLREVASLAGRTERAIQVRVRALGCRPRNARTCRPGTDVGVRRAGPRPPPLNAAATRRAAEAFAKVARALAASAEARAASDLQCAAARAERRTARTHTLAMTGAARQLGHLASAMQHTMAAQHALAAKPKRKAAKTSKPTARPDIRDAQERMMREQEARMWEAHQMPHRVEAAPSAASSPDADRARRIESIATRADTAPRSEPRIRRL